MSTATATPPLSSQPPLSEPARLMNVFVAPSKTFTDLNRKANWLAPFLIMTLLSFAYSYVISRQVTWKTVAENEIHSNPKAQERLEKLTPEQRDSNMALSLKITKGIGYVFPLLNLIWLLIVAAVLMATFNFGAGAEVKFSRALSVLMYASLPGLIKILIAIGVMYAPGFDPEGFHIKNPVATNPGAFFDPINSRFLYTLGSSIDIFMIWVLVLTAIGFACISNVKRSTSMIIVFGWYIVFALGSAGMSLMF